jgi:hypothetical protein
MSKKTIPFQMPKKIADETQTAAAGSISTPQQSLDRWVQPQEAPAEIGLAETEAALTSAVTITIPTAPNWFQAVKIAFFLPYLTVWVWTLGTAQKQLRVLGR